MQSWAMPVSRWMVDAIGPQPGHTVLELAAGPGETGLLAAELVQPGGTLICTDLAEPMLEVARQRAAAAPPPARRAARRRQRRVPRRRRRVDRPRHRQRRRRFVPLGLHAHG